MEPIAAFLAGLAVGLIVLAVVLLRAALGRRGEIDRARAESVRQSASTVRGLIAEQLAPVLPGFEYAPADCKFLGDPIDYVVFHGLTEARHGGGDLEEIEVVLLDVKHGKSELSPAQRAIARAVEAGRVRFRVVRIAPDLSVRTTDRRPRGRG
jgi:predicted Holliday junction resolvase-like endonuclease